MSISERLDQIQTAIGDHGVAAAKSAVGLPDREVMILLTLLLATAPGVSVEIRSDREADIYVGRAKHHAVARLGAPDEHSLIILRDRAVGLLTEDKILRTVWGAPLVLETANLLRSLQYARDEADGHLYGPARERFAGLERGAAAWGMPSDMLFTLSCRRAEIARADQTLVA